MPIFNNRARYEFRNSDNDAVKEELYGAGIPILTLPQHMDTEVKTSHVGLLNGFVFSRAWRYWVCEGDMPLDHAKVIYNQFHHLAVRAEGHAENPEPTGYSFIDDQNRQRLIERMRAEGVTNHEIMEALADLQEDPNSPRFVRCYHIDTSEGLKALAQYIKNNHIYACNGAEGTYAYSVYPVPEGE